MSDTWNDDEWVAAFLDGRLDERQRAEMLARLAADDAAYRHFAATAAILRDAEAAEAVDRPEPPAEAGGWVDAPQEEGMLMLTRSHSSGTATGESTTAPDAGQAPEPGTAEGERTTAPDAGRAPEPGPDRGVVPLQPRMRAPALRWLALAAGLAGLALVGRALWPRPSSGEPVRLAASLEHAEQGLPTEWDYPWSSPRGGDDPDRMSAEEKAAAAARAGTLLVDLSVAVRGRDAARTRLLAEQIAERYDPQARRDGTRDKFRDGAGGPPGRLEPLVERATDRIATRLGREALELGAWTEAARLAANRQDAGFFRETRPVLDRLASAATDPPARAAVDRVRRMVAADPPPWAALTPALDVLAKEIASE